MNLSGKAKRVRIYVNEGDLAGGRAVHLAIQELLRNQNASGATVLRAAEGTAGSPFHGTRQADAEWQQPLLIEWIDTAERVERLWPQIRELLPHGFVTCDETDVLHHGSGLHLEPNRASTAGDAMSRGIATVAPSEPVERVVELLAGKAYRAVPVVEAGLPAGIVTNSDLIGRAGFGVRMELLGSLDEPARQALLQDLSRAGRTAADVMTARPLTVNVRTPLTRVAELLVERRLKRMPVVDDGGLLVGMISRLDLLRSVSESPRKEEAARSHGGLAGDVPLARVGRREVPTVHLDTPLPRTFEAVTSTLLNRALVVDAEGRVLGIVSDEELLERVTPALRPRALRTLMHRLPFSEPNEAELALEDGPTDCTAGGVMNPDVVTARLDATLAQAIASLLASPHNKLVAVVDADRRLAGVLDRDDILRGLLAG
ncbi:MAG: DUF190 domain-containing protein [Candidatus Wallbacteria bacterium]|nr:DUF190 domain-containing protein [Candidatus Wallbacteria bacterium]